MIRFRCHSIQRENVEKFNVFGPGLGGEVMVKSLKLKIGLLVVSIFFILSPAMAGPDFGGEYATGKAEDILCGIDIYHINIEKVFTMYGKPTGIEVATGKDDQQYGPGCGGKTYTWSLPDLKMHFYSDYYTDKTTGKIIETPEEGADVSGIKPKGKIGLTGRGLALGDSFSTVLKIYGKSTYFFFDPKTGNRCAEIGWNDGTTLLLYFDKHDCVNYMGLSGLP